MNIFVISSTWCHLTFSYYSGASETICLLWKILLPSIYFWAMTRNCRQGLQKITFWVRSLAAMLAVTKQVKGRKWAEPEFVQCFQDHNSKWWNISTSKDPQQLDSYQWHLNNLHMCTQPSPSTTWMLSLQLQAIHIEDTLNILHLVAYCQLHVDL